MPKTVETRVGVCYNDFKYCTKGETGMLISLVVPCYNEEESLPIFYKEASKIAQQMGISHGADFEFIFVDDGSKDRTLQIARELHRKDARVRYISFSRNFGKEAGIYAGLKAAKGDYVATMDADLQDPPSLLPEMLELLLSGEYDCAATRRTTREGEPPVRSWFAKKFYQIINKLSDTEIVDGARDFRLMSRKMTDAVLSMTEYNRFSKGIFSWVGFNTKYIPYVAEERKSGKSSFNFSKLLKYGLDGIIAFSTMPLKISSYIGGLTVFLSLVYAIITVIRKLVSNISVDGFTQLVILVSFLGGIQLFTIGIMGEYLAKNYIETKKRPIYIAREIIDYDENAQI